MKPRRVDAATRLSLAWLSRLCDWRSCVIVVGPETVVRWHRAGWRLFWRYKSRPGRPPIPLELRQLIRRMASENDHAYIMAWLLCSCSVEIAGIEFLRRTGGILPRRRRRLGARRCENLARSSRPKRYCAGIGSWWRASGPSLSVTDGPAADGPAPCRTDPADGKREPQLGLHAHPGGDGQPWPPTGPRDDSPDPERSRIEPAPARGKGMPWSVFLKAHWRGVGGCRLLFG